MAKFLTSNELNAELEKIFDSADEQLILISPFIKLHDRYISSLRTKMKNHKLKITIVFGKNEDDISRSLKLEDFNFFKEFPNVEILYEKNLHAKYYANESSAILTSMNLYSYSQNNNIEAGVLVKRLGNLANSLLVNVTGENTLDDQASHYFERVIEQSELLFRKTPQYENANLGLSKKFKDSKIEIDRLSEHFEGQKMFENKSYKGNNEYKTNAQTTQIRKAPSGYCIRTKKEIPFNIKHPMSAEAYQSWAKYKDDNYEEKFCHFSGEPSNGETSMKNPILKRNWSKAKEVHGF